MSYILPMKDAGKVEEPKKPTLSLEEKKNIQVCLVRVAKLPETTEEQMKYLLLLSDKIAEIVG